MSRISIRRLCQKLFSELPLYTCIAAAEHWESETFSESSEIEGEIPGAAPGSRFSWADTKFLPASAALHLALSAQFEQALCTSILGISLLPRFPVFVLRFCLNFGQAMLKPRIIDFCHNIVSSTWKRQSAVICTPAAPVS